jgi:hypothetical protein
VKASASFALLVVVTALALSSCGSPGFPSGSGTATIIWTTNPGGNLSKPSTQVFGGFIAGLPMNGTADIPGIGSVNPAHPPPLLHVARWTGIYGGKSFALTVSLVLWDKTHPFPFEVDGEYGSLGVHATTTALSPHARTIDFEGTIGHHHITGTIGPVEHHHGISGTATIHFTVSG